jgi:hypothetical protein
MARESPKKHLNIEVKVEKVPEKILLKSTKYRSSTHFDEKDLSYQGKKRTNDSRSNAQNESFMSKYNSTLDISKLSQKMPNPYTPRSGKGGSGAIPKVKNPKPTIQLNLNLKPTVSSTKMYKNLQMGLPSQKSSNVSSNTAS